MDTGALFGAGGIVTLILGVGAAVQWWVARRDAKKNPIPKDQAAMALSMSAVTLMQTVADDVRRDMDALRERVESNEVAIKKHERLFGAAMGYIEALLRHIRDGRPQPPPPVPVDIRDLIDPNLHD